MWIESYGGLATPEGLELRGRVLRGARPIDGRTGPARNLGRMIGLFLTDEMPGSRCARVGRSRSRTAKGILC